MPRCPSPGLLGSSINPELVLKLARVMRVKVGGPGDFAKLGSKEAIIQKLEEKAGPEARKLFEKFVRDVQKAASAARTGDSLNSIQ